MGVCLSKPDRDAPVPELVASEPVIVPSILEERRNIPVELVLAVKDPPSRRRSYSGAFFKVSPIAADRAAAAAAAADADTTSPDEVLNLRKQLEQAEWQLVDLRTLTSTDVFQLMQAVMKEVDRFEEEQLSGSAKRIEEKISSDSTQNGDTGPLAQNILGMIMRFRQQGHNIHSDVNDEIIADSGLDIQTKKWLTTEFTRASIVRPTRFSFSLTKKGSMGLSPRPHVESIQHQPSVSIDLMIDQESFDVLQYTMERLIEVTMYIFNSGDLLRHYDIQQKTMAALIERIARSYQNSNPFHNFFHAVDVLHCCHSTFKRSRLDGITAGWQKLGFLLAAIAHDVGHPGTSNAFQVNTGSKLALIYNDISVLENHHAATLFRLVSEQEHNVFASLKPHMKSDIRSMILSSIMATDMKMHFDLVAKGDMVFEKIRMYIKHGLDGRAPMSPAFDESRKKEVKLALNIMLHFADINNICKEWPQAKTWSDLVVAEFYLQGDMEKQLKLPVSPFMDREKDSQAQMSLNFIDFIAGPLVSLIGDSFDNTEYLTRNMICCREQWQILRAKELSKMEPHEADKELEVLRSRAVEFNVNFVLRLANKRSSVTRTVAMINVQNQGARIARRNSLILAKELDVINNKSNSDKSDHELHRSSSAEDVKRLSKSWVNNLNGNSP